MNRAEKMRAILSDPKAVAKAFETAVSCALQVSGPYEVASISAQLTLEPEVPTVVATVRQYRYSHGVGHITLQGGNTTAKAS